VDEETGLAGLLAALGALYTFPGVRELLAPRESLGSIARAVEAALFKGGTLVSAPGSDQSDVTVFVCGRRWCQKEGQEHSWDGPTVEFPGGATVTCSRCGLDAMTHTLMTGA
jgi:hypothetical protein